MEYTKKWNAIRLKFTISCIILFSSLTLIRNVNLPSFALIYIRFEVRLHFLSYRSIANDWLKVLRFFPNRLVSVYSVYWILLRSGFSMSICLSCLQKIKFHRARHIDLNHKIYSTTGRTKKIHINRHNKHTHRKKERLFFYHIWKIFGWM